MSNSHALLFDDLPRQRDPVLYICHQAEGIQIEQRRDDGYIDATAMCRAYGKLFADYHRLDSTKEFLAELTADPDMGNPITALVDSRRGGDNRGNTWVHPEVAIDLAQWLSPKFRVRVNRWVLQWMQGRQPVFHKDEIEPFVIGRVIESLSRIEQKVDRVVDTGEHVHEKVERFEVRQQEMQLDLWRALGDPPRKPFVPAPQRGPARGTLGQPIPKLVEPRRA